MMDGALNLPPKGLSINIYWNKGGILTLLLSYSLSVSAARQYSLRSLYSPCLLSTFHKQKGQWHGVQLHHTARPEVLGFLFGFKCEQNIRFWETLPINASILIIVSNLLRLALGGSIYHTSNQAEPSLLLLFSQVVVQKCEIKKNANTETSSEERVC